MQYICRSGLKYNFFVGRVSRRPDRHRLRAQKSHYYGIVLDLTPSAEKFQQTIGTVLTIASLFNTIESIWN